LSICLDLSKRLPAERYFHFWPDSVGPRFDFRDRLYRSRQK